MPCLQQYSAFLTARALALCFQSRQRPGKCHMRPVNPNGFILLEVLVAMSLILGAWMASLASYQGIALRHGQQASKRQVLRLQWDQHELQEQARSQGTQMQLPNQPHVVNQGKKNESARMPSRNRPVRATTQSAITHQRANGQTTN